MSTPELTHEPTTRAEQALRFLPRQRWPYITLAALVLVAALSGALLGRFLKFDLPDVHTLEDYNPPVMTRVLAGDESTVATFAEQRRILIEHHEIPQSFVRALVATEDSRFYRHPGIDVRGAFRALWSDLRSRTKAEGASTLTMQLAGNLFLDRSEKTIRRKLQEVLLALEIERQYTKEEILRFYCNQIYTGHGRYGIEAASRYYFGHPASEMSLEESALLAGVINRPSSLSPFTHPERALARRNHVLRRMVDVGFLTREQASETAALPVVVSAEHRIVNPAPYFVEEVRRWLQDKFGSSSLYKEGLEVTTTLDPRLQQMANAAVDKGLRELDKRQGWRGASDRIPEGEDPLLWEAPDWEGGVEQGAVHDGLVLEVDRNSARVRVGPYEGTLDAKAVAWTEKRPGELFADGDRIRVRVEELREDGTAVLSLEQEPAVEAAFVAIEPATGAVRALVGGFDFERSEYDRAIQAKRQTGSAFKPFVYAAALSEGLTLGRTILDEPTVFLDRRNPEPYQPENFTNKYYETVTLRTALEKSANIATVKLLTEVGYRPVIAMARRLGIQSQLEPFPSLALGAFEVSLLELTAAYGAFANRGVWVEPHLVREVRNRDGAIVSVVEPQVTDAVSPQIAYLMNRVLAGVITDGTGRAAASLDIPLAGKTGTTDNNTDAWFIGYSPDLAVGVWVGFDEPRSLGKRETGAIAALPIWRAFMEAAYADRAALEFDQPAGIVLTSIDRQTGLKANRQAGCEAVYSEVFIAGTEPTEYCTKDHHQLLGFPYRFHRFRVDARGAVAIPADELDLLLAEEVNVYLVDGGSRLEAHMPTGTYSMRLQLLPGSLEPRHPAALAERFDTAEWVGLDGRTAHVEWID